MSTEELEKRVEEIVSAAKVPDRPTRFQVEKFMIGKEVTGQAQLWACARELEVAQETVDNLRRDLANAEDDLELIDVQVERLDLKLREEAGKEGPEAALNVRELELNIRKLQRRKEGLVRSARQVQRKLAAKLEEMSFLVAGHDEIVKKIGPMRPLDDEDSQREMWGEKLLEEFNLRVIFQRPLDPEFVRTVMCLHDEAPVKKHITSLIGQIQARMIADRKASESSRQSPQIEAKPRVVGK